MNSEIAIEEVCPYCGEKAQFKYDAFTETNIVEFFCGCKLWHKNNSCPALYLKHCHKSPIPNLNKDQAQKNREELIKEALPLLNQLDEAAEHEYEMMYECRGQRNKDIRCAKAKTIFAEAAFFASLLGLPEEADRLIERIEHLKETHRRFFSGWSN